MKAREVFKLRSKMMDLRMNYKNMYTGTKCPRCNRPDSATFKMVQEGDDINKLWTITNFLMDEISARE